VQAFERTLTSDDLLAYLRSLPAAAVPRVVVLDNASVHVSKAFQAQRRELARQGATRDSAEQGFDSDARKLRPKRDKQLRLAA